MNTSETRVRGVPFPNAIST